MVKIWFLVPLLQGICMEYKKGDKVIAVFNTYIHDFQRYNQITINSNFYGIAYWVEEDFIVPVAKSALVPSNKFTRHLYAVSDN